ncbi:MAG TPA: cob(I)yrinic acid a,c-diamide adenosyltransferase [Myxococcales bacterium]|nr:cob(I)yrinic acid a,c-diamide adenosyltransferase [Myxococcales bacterium]
MAKIYTRRGDDGSTGLFGGPRVRKDDLRVAAYGDVDELNSALGVAREEVPEGDLRALIDSLQSELFTLGAQLATPDTEAAPKEVPHITAERVARLESEIDRLTEQLPPMKNFILPGGSRPGAALHLCRTICRRAERKVVELAESGPVPPEALAYVNRLSDLLFVMARAANLRAGGREIPWIPTR